MILFLSMSLATLPSHLAFPLHTHTHTILTYSSSYTNHNLENAFNGQLEEALVSN